MSGGRPKVPNRPPDALTRFDTDVQRYTDRVWRIHRTAGPHVTGWSAPRIFGPVPSMRFDPHPEGPPTLHPGIGVLYATTDIATAAAEVFQRTRLIDTTTGAPYLTGWRPTRPLHLLDLSSTWALRNGAAYAVASAQRPVCRAWARRIHDSFDDLDGLAAPSTMTGAVNIVLWERAADSMPAAPDFTRPLTHPTVWEVLRRVANRIGYRMQ